MKRLLVISFALALSAFSVIFLCGFILAVTQHFYGIKEGLSFAFLILLSFGEQPELTICLVSFVLTISWIFHFAKALAKFRRRGLWLLTSLPIALFWPVAFLYIFLACARVPGGCAI
jgi:hypothetical protein